MAGYAEHVRAGHSASTLNDIWSAQSTLSRTMGRHLMKAGAQCRLYRMIRTNVGNQNGSYCVQQRLHAAQRAAPATARGNAFASFLLGYPSGGSVDINAESDQRYPQLQPVRAGRLEAQRTDHAQPRAALGLPVGR